MACRTVRVPPGRPLGRDAPARRAPLGDRESRRRLLGAQPEYRSLVGGRAHRRCCEAAPASVYPSVPWSLATGCRAVQAGFRVRGRSVRACGARGVASCCPSCGDGGSWWRGRRVRVTGTDIDGDRRRPAFRRGALRRTRMGGAAVSHTSRQQSSKNAPSPDCSAPGKHPRLVNGLNGASTDRAAIEQWWNRWPEAKSAFAPARPADSSWWTSIGAAAAIEPCPNWSTSTTSCRPLSPSVPVTGCTCTSHIPDGRSETTPAVGWGPGIDVRGEGGYVLGATQPPRCAGASATRQLTADAPLATMPTWMGASLRRFTTPRSNRSIVVGGLVHDPIGVGTSGAYRRGADGGTSRDGHTQCEPQPSGVLPWTNCGRRRSRHRRRSSERYSMRRWRLASATAKRAPTIRSCPGLSAGAGQPRTPSPSRGPTPSTATSPQSGAPSMTFVPWPKDFGGPSFGSVQRLRRAVLDQRARPNLGDGAARDCATARVRGRFGADRHRTARSVSRRRRRRPSLSDATHTRSSRTVRLSHRGSS